MKATSIYALADPRTDEVCYVGKANNPRQRLIDHLADTKTNKGKVVWLAELQASGLEPKLRILEEVSRSGWKDAERWWIAHGLAQGWPLLNMTPGGEGGDTRDHKVSALEFFRSYLAEDDWQRFIALDYQRAWRICRLTAMVMVEYSDVAVKARGQVPDQASRSMAAWVGWNTARNLVRAATDPAEFELWEKNIKAGSDRTMDCIERYVQGLNRRTKTATVPNGATLGEKCQAYDGQTGS